MYKKIFLLFENHLKSNQDNAPPDAVLKSRMRELNARLPITNRPLYQKSGKTTGALGQSHFVKNG